MFTDGCGSRMVEQQMGDRYLLYPYQTRRIVSVREPKTVRQQHCGLQDRNATNRKSGSEYHSSGYAAREKESRCGVAAPQRLRVPVHITSILPPDKSYGIMPSMPRCGNPYDNAMAKNFFSILKKECIYRHKPATFSEANEMIDRYIHFTTTSASIVKQEWRR